MHTIQRNIDGAWLQTAPLSLPFGLSHQSQLLRLFPSDNWRLGIYEKFALLPSLVLLLLPFLVFRLFLFLVSFSLSSFFGRWFGGVLSVFCFAVGFSVVCCFCFGSLSPLLT